MIPCFTEYYNFDDNYDKQNKHEQIEEVSCKCLWAFFYLND